jgi:LacI family transcriptional regulator
VAAVLPDERAAGRTAARTLLAAGHRDRIWLVGESPAGVYAGRERRLGIAEVLSGTQLTLARRLDCLWWPEPSYAAVREALLANPPPPTAIICLNDRAALGAYQALAEAALTVPGDVSLLSFDDSDLASWLRPQLSSIAIPHFHLGQRAVELLLGGPAPGVYPIPMPLRERASIGPPVSS